MGSLKVQTNLYKSSYQDELIATNTFINHQIEGSNFQLGNITENLHRGIWGRGVSGKLKIENQTALSVGVIDNQYNLLERKSFFEEGYTAYAIGEIGNYNSKKSFKTIYAFQDDIYEKNHINTVGGEYQQTFNNQWSLKTRFFGAVSDYYLVDKQKISYSSEAEYRGQWKNYSLSGFVFLNSNYFPGERRGIKQIHQYINKRIKNNNQWYLRFSYGKISPKSVTNSMTSLSESFSGETGVSLNMTDRLSFTLRYQFQHESSNSYNFFLVNNDIQQYDLNSNTLSESLTWKSINLQHTGMLTIENGLTKYPLSDELKPLIRANVIYSYKWFQFMGIFQYGGFTLSEYFQSFLNQKDTFKRLYFNAGVNKQFFNKSLEVYSGLGFNKDYMWSETPSGFLKITQHISNRFSVYVNGMWYEYLSDYYPSSQTYNIEFGLTANLQGAKASDKKKGNVTVFIYYDHNGNSIYDEGDSPAVGYYLTFNKSSFVTNLEGKFTYKLLPFGNYKIGSSSNKGWFNPNLDVKIDQYQSYIEIPLQQMGSISGKIQYLFNEKVIADFIPKKEGISFKISQGNTFVRRVVTNSDGEFTTFLPKGDYIIELEASSLQKDVTVNKTVQYSSTTPGKIYKIPTFELEPKQRKVNVKKFGE